MSFIDGAVLRTRNCLASLCDSIFNREKAIEKEAGDSNVITILVLAVVAVGLCVIFRNELYKIVIDVTNQVHTKINELVNMTVQNS